MSMIRSTLGPALAIALGATALSGASITAATANPGDGTPGSLIGSGTVTVAGEGPFVEGSTITITGTGLTYSPADPKVSIKIDAVDNATFYRGGAITSPNGLVATFPVHADGSFHGTLLIPADINDPAVNPGAAGPHWLRILSAGTSLWSNDFVTIDAPATDPGQPTPGDKTLTAAKKKVAKDRALIKKLHKRFAKAKGAKKAKLKKKLAAAKKQLRRDLKTLA